MMFDEYTKNQIINKNKTVTRRMNRTGRRPAIPGKRHKIKIDRTPEVYGEILIKDCHLEPLSGLTDEEGRKEGFNDKEDYLKYFKTLNGDVSLDTLIWRVEFELIEDDTMKMRQGYLINELHNEFLGSKYTIGIECDYEIKDGKIRFNKEPQIYFKQQGIFMYLNDAVLFYKGGEDLEKFKKHLKRMQEDEEYNKKICKYFMKMAEKDYPEDIYEGLYYEFNEY